jgi:pyruvate formate lyase activating enzyme
MEKEAVLYDRLDEERVRCMLCAHRCIIAEGKRGICLVRENRGGVLHTLVYGRTIARHVDPVEKKPLYHFMPGSLSFSIATPGCNFHCPWCQNWEIALMPAEQRTSLGESAAPQQLVDEARRSECRSIAYTYTEPTVFYEYARDTAALAHEAGLANIYVTNGFMTSEMLDHFHPYLDAANVDLKAFRDETYRRAIGGALQPVLDSMKKMVEMGTWLEVTTLIVPGVNDDLDELKDAAEFIAQELGPDVPWHLSRYFPHYKTTELPPTSLDILHRAFEIGKNAGLRYVYLGNVAGESNTQCYQCGQVLVQRSGYFIASNQLQETSRCPHCSAPIAGHWH